MPSPKLESSVERAEPETPTQKYEFLFAHEIRAGDVCRRPGTLALQLVVAADHSPDRTILRWVDSPPTNIHNDMIVVKYGKKTNIATAFHSIHATDSHDASPDLNKSTT